MTEQKIITYSLRDGAKKSNQYYEDVGAFTDAVLAEGEKQFDDLIGEMGGYVKAEEIETQRLSSEYVLDVLVMGVLGRVYLPHAAALNAGRRRMLENLVQIRKKSALLKPVADALRGVVGAVSLFALKSNQVGLFSNLEDLRKLVGWLRAAGEFKEEVRRLELWQGFLEGKQDKEAARILAQVSAFSEWFERVSLDALGKYTPNIEAFLERQMKKYRWREDRVFCGRQRVEYHLNMVGSQIMNRAYREAFRDAERKVVLVPPCMKAKLNAGCEAVETPYGERCMACTPECRVHQATKLGEKYGVQVFMLPDDLSIMSGGGGGEEKGGLDAIGVVGVSCPLTISTGGWETRRLGVPAQGLLLDYCGCKWHWDLEKGLPTDINFEQLVKIITE